MKGMESAIESAIAIMKMKNQRKRKKKQVAPTKGYILIGENTFDVDDIKEVQNSALIVASSPSDRRLVRRGAVCESGDLERILIKETLKQLFLRQWIKDDYL